MCSTTCHSSTNLQTLQRQLDILTGNVNYMSGAVLDREDTAPPTHTTRSLIFIYNRCSRHLPDGLVVFRGRLAAVLGRIPTCGLTVLGCTSSASARLLREERPNVLHSLAQDKFSAVRQLSMLRQPVRCCATHNPYQTSSAAVDLACRNRKHPTSNGGEFIVPLPMGPVGFVYKPCHLFRQRYPTHELSTTE